MNRRGNASGSLVIGFDGDECNLHVPQTQGARTETATISRTDEHIVSAQHNACVMGAVQNTLLFMFVVTETFSSPEITDPDQESNYKFADGTSGWQTLVRLSDFMDAITAANISPARVESLIQRSAKYYPEYVIKKKDGTYKLKDMIPGKIVASIVFSPFFTWSRDTGTNKKLSIVKIKDGIMLPDSGPMCKKIIGGTAGSSIHPVWKDSHSAASDVISELQLLTTILITRIGFSMGLSDCMPTGTVDVKGAIQSALVKCDIINSSDKDPAEKEREINGALNEAMSISPDLARSGMNKGDRNSLVIMKKAGAKGTDTNNGQIAGFVGQQNIDGGRMPLMLCDGTRSLPCFKKGDNSPAARGFVAHSFVEGLTPYEMWFHAMGGRRGVVDTALKSVTGDTEIVVYEDQNNILVTPYTHKIGDFIDRLLSQHPDKIAKYKEQNMEYLDISHLPVKYYINTINHLGVFSVELITAVTRHDPTEILFQVTTQSGREVIVTDSKSLLVWRPGPRMFVQSFMRNVMVGDLLPVSLSEDVSDISLDPIVTIEHISPAPYRYVYDLTVPSTTNFGLANGLYVVDTADSGYVEKKIVNMINDFKINYDGTVRDANGTIIQFLYGGDGFNAREMIGCKGLDDPFFISPVVIADCLNSEAEQTVGDSDRGEKRILARDEMNFVLGKIQFSALGEKTRVTERATFNTRKCLRKICCDIKIYECMIPRFCRRILDEFEGAKAKYGYMAGLVAALSMGEPTSQATLNSVAWETLVYVRYEKEIETTKCGLCLLPIGKLIDGIIEQTDQIVFYPNDTEYVDVSHLNATVLSVNEDGKVYWKKLEAVTRHPPGGKLVHVKTRSGREVRASKSKSFLVKENNKIVPKLGSEIKVGDQVPVVMRVPEACDSYVSREQGYERGIDLAINASTVIDISGITSNIEYAAGILDGYFSTATLHPDKITHNCSDSVFKYIAELCSRFGVFVTKEADSLAVDCHFAKILHSKVGLSGNIGEYIVKKYLVEDSEIIDSDVYFDEIISVEEVDSSHPKVYDFTVEDTRTFTLFGGLAVYDTFHAAGISAKDVTLGVPRLKEILNATKNPSKPGCTVYLDNPEIHTLMEKHDKSDDTAKIEVDKELMLAASSIAFNMPSVKVSDILVSKEIKYLKLDAPKKKGATHPITGTPINLIQYTEYEPEWWVDLWEDLGNEPKHRPQCWMVLINLNLEKMYHYKITTDMVAKAIEDNSFGSRGYALGCVPSPNNIAQVEIYINFEEIDKYARDAIELPPEEIKRHLVTKDNINYFITRDVAIKLIKDTVVKGIRYVEKTFIRQDYKTKEWMIDTQGSNLQELLGMPGIDPTRTTSDDMWEIYNTLGLEATRTFLFREITKILSFDGTYINKRHVYLLVDAMLRCGTITPVSRDGISRDVGPIAKGLFEKTVENFAESSAFCEQDMMQGVAASIMYGTLPPVGTGTVEIKDAERMPSRR
jgi:DNA-directed RNA polymerase beta' subunit